jgi:uncharacterized protein
MIDYPGFGRSTGKLTTANMKLQAEHLYLLARSHYTPQNILIYGKSMGTGPASDLAAHYGCRHLVLETPYFSLSSLAAHYAPILPIRWLIDVDFNNGESLKKVHATVTIFHGTADETVPYGNAAKLKAALKSTDQFITIEGGRHNGLADSITYQQEMKSILGF